MKPSSAITILLLFFLGLTIPVHASPLILSPEEEVWVKSHKTIRISGPVAFPPFQYTDSEGSFIGMASDYVILIAEMAGLKIEKVNNLPWAEILNKTEKGDIDLLTCAVRTSDREKYLTFLKPHLSFPLVIISKRDAPFISGTKSLSNKRVAMVKKNAVFDWLQRDQITVTPVFTDSPLDDLRSVSLGKADASIENLATATYLIEKYGLTNLKVAAPTSYENYELSIAVHKNLPELSSIFSKGLAAIDQDKHNEIRQKWISVRYEHGVSPKDIIKWVLIICAVALLPIVTFYVWNRRLKKEIEKRILIEAEKEQLIRDLTKALDEIKTLRGILPLCSFCKKIRDDSGHWEQVDIYILKNTKADISHGICPDCMKIHYAEYCSVEDSES